MKKSDLLILLILFGLWFAWGPIDRLIFKPLFPPKEPVPAEETVTASDPADRVLPVEAAPGEIAPLATPGIAPAAPAPVLEGAKSEGAAVEAQEADLPDEQLVVLTNDSVRITFSSRGAGIVDVRLPNYRERNLPDSGPVDLVFGERMALAYAGLPGLSSGTSHFDFEVSEDGRTLVATAAPGHGLRLQRRIELGDSYALQVTDTFLNETEQALQIPEARLQFGPMQNLPDETLMVGVIPLGVDSSSPGEKVKRWERDFKKLFSGSPEARVEKMNRTVDWVAVKNRYFVQSIIPVDGAPNFTILGRWDGEAKSADLVSASLIFDPAPLLAGSGVVRPPLRR